eukprot:764851-Hanusia_phi.AAC.12
MLSIGMLVEVSGRGEQDADDASGQVTKENSQKVFKDLVFLSHHLGIQGTCPRVVLRLSGSACSQLHAGVEHGV